VNEDVLEVEEIIQKFFRVRNAIVTSDMAVIERW
jgi:hypothetical protein